MLLASQRGGAPFMTADTSRARRRFLQFLAQSPLAYALGASLPLRELAAQDDAVLSGGLKWADLIKSPDQALNVWDFEPVMRNNVGAHHYAYMAQGADDFGTIAANRAGFKKIALRPQRLVDVTHIDMSVELFGQRYASPIFLCPVGAQQSFHPEGERSRSAARREDEEPAPGALDRRELLGRGREQGARRADLVPALSDDELGRHAGDGQTRRARRVRSARAHGRHSGAQSSSRARASIASTIRSAKRATRPVSTALTKRSTCSTASTSRA